MTARSMIDRMGTLIGLILVAIVSAITSLGSIAKLRSIGLRSALWLLGSPLLPTAVPSCTSPILCETPV